MALLRARRLLIVLLCLAVAPPTAAAGVASSEELELELATRPVPYLRIDLAARTLEVRLRGRTLEIFELTSVELLRAGGLDEPPPPLELPAVWHVANRPPSNRQLSAPAYLLEPGEEPADLRPAAAAEPRLPPDTYAFATRGGQRVEVGRPRAPVGALAGWWAAIADGWARSRGRHEPLPDRLHLGLPPDAASHLHHLFRPGVALVLVASRDSPAELP